MIRLDEHIRGNRFKDMADVVITQYEPLDDYKIGRILRESNIIFCKTDFVKQLYACIESCQYPQILITHNSDFHIDEELYSKKPPCIRKWFARNIEIDRPDLVAIPIGIENDGEGRSGNIAFMNGVRNGTHMMDNTVYMNINLTTHPGHREEAFNALKDKDFITVPENMNNLSFEQYCRDTMKHLFSVSPPGNGVDCHRTWEILFMGRIPIVKNSLHMSRFSDLRIMIVNDWSEITMDSLGLFLERSYNNDKQTFSYWKKEILDARSGL